MSRICLRVLSGPHLGAAIELPPGLYLVGSGTEADIILAADETVAGRHLEIQVREEPEGFGVAARPLEAPAVLSGRGLPPEGLPIPPGEVLALGFTALAWRPAGESWGPITLAPLEYVERLADTSGGPETPAEAAGPEGLPENPAGPAEESRALEPATFPKEPATDSGERWTFRLGLAILLILLGLLTLGDWGEGLTRQAAADRLNALLADNGLGEVRAEPEDGALVLRGLAADDRELSLITRLAAAQPFPVRVEVRIQDDRLRAVRETMNARGFFPEVRLGPEDRLEIAVYMRDALVEDQAFSLLDDDLRGLARAVRRVVHARELRPVLERELNQAGLGRVEAEYLDGQVRLALTPDTEERRRLNEVLEKVGKALGAPVLFQLADGRTKRAAEPPAATTLAPLAAEPDPTRLEVMSVTQGPLPFITLSDGQKFFIGGVLPNGATLVGIEAGHLEMALGDNVIIQSLEENQ